MKESETLQLLEQERAQYKESSEHWQKEWAKEHAGNKAFTELMEFAPRVGWDGLGTFMNWLKSQLIRANQSEVERQEYKQKSCQFTRWWYSSRHETMHSWMRKHAPEDVKRAYFSIVANGSAEFCVPDQFKIQAADGKVAESLMEAADNAVKLSKKLEREHARFKAALEAIVSASNTSFLSEMAEDALKGAA